ncbi:MAG TPA: NAD(P)-dependent alcohol dehydrogenase [Acidimicrobiales bacterium]|jgi:NADPH:quinone reductase-like Zn-dependent oxidoreductase|nr:NAD(P)-dependent alcohol dehydrogenase [Acidimicrobiales bacterium]
MKAVVHERFGPDAVELSDVPAPEVTDEQVLIRVRASSVNPLEWYDVYAPPFVRLLGGQLRRPKDVRLGVDVAGTVEAVGGAVEGLVPGDEVFGTARGAWAELAVANSSLRLARKPPEVSFEDAAGVPIAGLTALQGLRDHGEVQAGQKVLVNGASGGVGTYAVQIAKALGADVTAVCSPRNVELAGSLGADRVVDYTAEDFTRLGVRHDLLLDVAGSRSFLACRRVLTRDARVVVVGAKMQSSLLGPLKHIAGTYLKAIGRSQTVKFFVAKVETADLEFLARLLADGRMRTVVDRRYDLSSVRDALAYLGEGHARGKVIVGA